MQERIIEKMLHLDLTIGLVFVKFIFDNSQL